MNPQTYIKYSPDFSLSTITAEAFEAIDWLADLPQRTWPQTGRSSDVTLLKLTAAILAAVMFVVDCTTASTSLAGAAAVHKPSLAYVWFSSLACFERERSMIAGIFDTVCLCLSTYLLCPCSKTTTA